jgi:hypothetical protein
MLVRVATNDVASAKLLVVDLVGLFGGEHVSLQADGEVHLQVRGEVNGALVRTASAQVCVDEHSYTIEHPQRFQRSTDPTRSNGSAHAQVKAMGRR